MDLGHLRGQFGHQLLFELLVFLSVFSFVFFIAKFYVLDRGHACRLLHFALVLLDLLTFLVFLLLTCLTSTLFLIKSDIELRFPHKVATKVPNDDQDLISLCIEVAYVINRNQYVVSNQVPYVLAFKFVLEVLRGVEEVRRARHLNVSQVVRVEARTLHAHEVQNICEHELSNVIERRLRVLCGVEFGENLNRHIRSADYLRK